MASFLTKRKEQQSNGNFFTGDDDAYAEQKRRKLPAEVDPGAADRFVPVDLRGSAQPNTSPTPQQTPMATFSNDPTDADRLSAILNSPLGQLPAYRQALELRNKRIALEMQPTYTNSKGEIVQGMQDKDGRLKSGLKGLLQGAAQNFDPRHGVARDWNDFYARLSGTIATGFGGALVPEWNEWAEREREVASLRQQEQEAMKQGEFESKMLTGAVNRESKVAADERQKEALKIRASRAQVLNMKDEKKTLLDPIMKRGYYYEGDNPAEDEALAKANVILPDFDNTRKAIVENGVRKAWDPETRAYKQAEGTDVDPDDVPVTFMVDGQEITASRKHFLGYKGAQERQKSQQEFQRGENDKTRAVQWARITQAAEQFRAKTAEDFTAKTLAIKASLDAGEISPQEAQSLFEILKKNNPNFQK